MRCRHCGSEMPNHAAFCPSCGQKVIAADSVYGADMSDKTENQIEEEEFAEVYDDSDRRFTIITVAAAVAFVLLASAILFFTVVKPRIDRNIDPDPPAAVTDDAGTEDQTATADEPQSEANQSAETASEYPKTMYVTADDGLLLRKGPGKDNEALGAIEYGTEIKVEEEKDGWARTTANGETGWCSMEYLTANKSDIKPKEKKPAAADSSGIVQPSNVAQEGHVGRVTSDVGVNVRTGPGTQYDVIDGLPFDAEAIERGWQDGWVYIEYNGKFGWIIADYFTMAYGREKPAIYLYPTKKSEVDVKVVLKSGEFIKTIPRSESGEWSVIADPSGIITDPANGKTYDYIFWESTDDTDYDWSEGYIIAGYEAEDFLTTVLPKMGLNEKEARQFKEYWVPRLERHKYNLVTFQGACYTDSAALEVYPKPDSVLRLFMVFKGIDEPVKIKAPKIKAFERKGFSVVEWGGAEVR